MFVGYGIQAPEYQWDDYKGVDLAGKTVIVLINDPPVPDPADPSRLDPKTFGGRAMTYYGRWTYKYEMGAEKKAAAVFIVHETGPAAYPFSVVQSKVTEQFDLVTADRNRSRAAIEGWITLDQAKTLFALAGQDFDALKARAATRAFTPVPMGVTASMTVNSRIRTFDSRNVVGILPGSDPALKDEYVDLHGALGPLRHRAGDRRRHDLQRRPRQRDGHRRHDRSRPGLRRDAGGAEAVAAVPRGHRRGAGAARLRLLRPPPDLPAEQDARRHQHGRAQHLRAHEGPHGRRAGRVGPRRLRGDAAAAQGRVLRADPKPENGGYFRSDHFPFAKQGVPAINAGGGDDYIGRPAGWGQQVQDAYTAQHYHKPSDEIRPDWDLSGALEDLQIYYADRRAGRVDVGVAAVEAWQRVQGAAGHDAGYGK